MDYQRISQHYLIKMIPSFKIHSLIHYHCSIVAFQHLSIIM